MNRTWITGLTLASVAGSGGAFAAVATSGNDAPVAAQTLTAVKASEFVQAPQSRTVNYQVGAAGTVTLTATDGALAVDAATVGTGWSVVTTTAVGSHVEAAVHRRHPARHVRRRHRQRERRRRCADLRAGAGDHCSSATGPDRRQRDRAIERGKRQDHFTAEAGHPPARRSGTAIGGPDHRAATQAGSHNRSLGKRR